MEWLFLIHVLCSACLIWAFMCLIRTKKSLPQKFLGLLMVLAFISFYGDAAFYDDSYDAVALVVIDALSQFVTPCIPPLMLVTIWTMNDQRVNKMRLLGWFALPMMLGVTSVLLYCLVGLEESAAMMPYINKGVELPAQYQTPICLAHVFVEKILFYVILGLEMLILVGVLIYNIIKNQAGMKAFGAFVAGKAKMQTKSVLAWLMLMLAIVIVARCAAIPVYYCHPWMGGVMSVLLIVLICLICNLVLNVKVDSIKISSIGNVVLSADALTTEQEDEAEAEEQETPFLERQEIMANNASGINMSSEAYARLLNAFNKILLEDKAYLDEDFTLNDVVDRLGVNRSYISYLVNKEYCMSFRDVVGNLRIEYAMQYMKEHPNCLQDTVAQKCGFSSASTFNRKFNQVVGMTPRLWLTRNLPKDEADKVPLDF